ncbi:MAG: ThuA domain-containing protein [Verrucomicrobiota bacterium]
MKTALTILSMFAFAYSAFAEEVLVYEGESGPGAGKHLVFIASDHEYHSEETCPAIARILAKRFGFKCTVLFGQDDNGYIKKGGNNIPGMEALKEADLLFLFLRFQNWEAAQMDQLIAYLERGGPVIGLRTTTHAFKIGDKESPYIKFSDNYTGEDFPYGFGKQILGLSWSKYGGHYSRNHQQSVQIDVVAEKAEHPINRGVKDAWAYGGGYRADLGDECEVLSMAQPLVDIYPGSEKLTEKGPQPAAWTRSYSYEGGPEGKVFTTIYGGSPDIVNRGFRRMLINAVFWGVGLEDKIDGTANVNFVGPYTPTFGRYTPARNGQTKPSDLAGWDSEIFPHSEMKDDAKVLFTQEQLDEQSGD